MNIMIFVNYSTIISKNMKFCNTVLKKTLHKKVISRMYSKTVIFLLIEMHSNNESENISLLPVDF